MQGKRLFLELLKQEGVTHLFGNPGTTELPLMDALAVEDDIRYIVTLQEAVALAMADGYARSSGKLGVVNLHVAPGLGNAMGMLFDASKAGTPLLVTCGQQAQGFGLMEPNLYAELPPLAAPLVKWAFEVRNARDFPRVIHRAAKVALAPPTGPVFVSLPTDVMNQDADVELGRPSRVAPHYRGDPAAIKEAAVALAASARPVFIAGDCVAQSKAHAELVALAELLGAPVYLEGESDSNEFPTSHPLCAGHLARSAKVIHGVLSQHDLLLSIGADLFTLSMPPEMDFVPDDLPIVHLDTDPWQLGKNFHTAAAIMGDPKTTLPELTDAVRAAMNAEHKARAEKRSAETRGKIAARRAQLVAKATSLADKVPVPPIAAMHAVGDILPPDAIIIDEAISSGEGLREFFKGDRTDSYHGVKGGGIGWGIPGAVGVKLAHPDRPVVALIGDGSAMYTLQGLWTAAHDKVAVIFVILVNRNYNILQQRLRTSRGYAAQTNRYVGMELTNPNIDYVGLGRSMGLESHGVSTLKDFRERLQTALSSKTPVLIALDVERAEV
jgi:benzoylformate decarboxylase